VRGVAFVLYASQIWREIAIDILTEFVSCVGEVLLVGTVLDIPGRVQVQE